MFTSRSRRPATATDTCALSSLTTITIASVSSQSPSAARWRVPNERSFTVDWVSGRIAPAVRTRMDAATCALYRAVPVRERDDGTLVVALADPVNVSILQDLSFIVGAEVEARTAPWELVERLRLRLDGRGDPKARERGR